jgi:hypothetical protein
MVAQTAQTRRNVQAAPNGVPVDPLAAPAVVAPPAAAPAVVRFIPFCKVAAIVSMVFIICWASQLLKSSKIEPAVSFNSSSAGTCAKPFSLDPTVCMAPPNGSDNIKWSAKPANSIMTNKAEKLPPNKEVESETAALHDAGLVDPLESLSHSFSKTGDSNVPLMPTNDSKESHDTPALKELQKAAKLETNILMEENAAVNSDGLSETKNQDDSKLGALDNLAVGTKRVDTNLEEKEFIAFQKETRNDSNYLRRYSVESGDASGSTSPVAVPGSTITASPGTINTSNMKTKLESTWKRLRGRISPSLPENDSNQASAAASSSNVKVVAAIEADPEKLDEKLDDNASDTKVDPITLGPNTSDTTAAIAPTENATYKPSLAPASNAPATYKDDTPSNSLTDKNKNYSWIDIPRNLKECVCNPNGRNKDLFLGVVANIEFCILFITLAFILAALILRRVNYKAKLDRELRK